MRFVRKGSKYYYQLVLSYLIIVFTVTTIIGVFSTKYFSTVYNRELISVNQKLLYHLARIIEESVLQQAFELYENLAVKNKDNLELLELFDVPLKGHFASVKPASDYLKQIVGSNSKLVDSIHVYYRNNDIIISSRNGIVYPVDNYFNMDNLWLQRFRETKDSTFWLPSRTIGQIENVDIVSLVKVFPAISGFETYKGLICINIRESAVLDIISAQQIADEDIFILDRHGQTVSETVSLALSDAEIDDILENPNSSDNLIRTFADVKSMASYTTIESNDWKIINITPIRNFRRNLHNIQRVIFLACIVSIIMGIIVTIVFSTRMYNPLRSVVDRLGEMSKSKENEYTLINNALDTLTNQVHTLERTMSENKPLIRHNIVSGLLRHRFSTEAELFERLNMLKIIFDLPYYYAALIDMRSFMRNQRSLEDSQSAKYNLISYFDHVTSADSQYLASEISDHEIALIINSRNASTEFQTRAMTDIINSIFIEPKRYPVTTIGRCVTAPLEIHDSFEIVQVSQKYRYFTPNDKFRDGDKLVTRESSRLVFEDSIFAEFSRALKLNDLALVTSSLDQIITRMKHESFSYDYCYRKLVELVTIFEDFAKELNIDIDDTLSSNERRNFQDIENIDAFREWITGRIGDAFTYLKNRSKNKHYTAIEQAKKYIMEHIESDLYLDKVAENIVLKPHYFSKLFKEYTGSSFVSYVNARKMDRAAQLLLDSDVSIAEISNKLSFSSAAYFIKKFKAFSGMTPNDYRSRRLREKQIDA
jgi:two-component system, response regulator YesN